MTTFFRSLLAAAVATSLMLPAAAAAKTSDKKHFKGPKITVHPKYRSKHRSRHHRHGYGFLPGYRQPPNLTDWRDRSTRRRRSEPPEWRYWHNGQLHYGWGYPGFYRGRWTGGSFGPCWTSTPIGMMWNCGN
jgi:hypothetical protein